MRRIAIVAAGSLAALTLAGAGSVAAQSSSSGSDALATYSNCDQLNRDYRHGVSDRRMTKREWVRKGASGKGAYKPNLYNRVEANLDRDNDHIACES